MRFNGRSFIKEINNYTDHIWIDIKQQITKQLNSDIVCIFVIIYVMPYIII